MAQGDVLEGDGSRGAEEDPDKRPAADREEHHPLPRLIGARVGSLHGPPEGWPSNVSDDGRTDLLTGTRDIRERFGLQKALGYLIGEKLLDFLRVAKEEAPFEVPSFVAEIREIFDRDEIRTYLDSVQRVGVLGHNATDDDYEEMREAGAIDEDPVWWAEDILLIERANELLLADDGGL